MMDNEFEIKFLPGCFDNFDGTQEELDNLIKEIQDLVSSGKFFEEAEPVDLDNESEEVLEIINSLMNFVDENEDLINKRKKTLN